MTGRALVPEVSFARPLGGSVLEVLASEARRHPRNPDLLYYVSADAAPAGAPARGRSPSAADVFHGSRARVATGSTHGSPAEHLSTPHRAGGWST
jgi:hypothetical protein